ncbi:MAG: tetratricopeptide repeat protein, partial [Dongiaceae bacterium]
MTGRVKTPADKYLEMGVGFAGEERFAEAERAYRTATELDPKNPWAWSLLGKVLHENLDRRDEAEQANRRSLSIDHEIAWISDRLDAL